MQLTSFAAVALLAQYAAAQGMLRFACSQLVVDRVDPLVDPGMIYSPHLHQIVGGNSFNATMDPSSHDPAKVSTCTSCSFKEDKSNYWTAVMFFKAKNGTYKRVPQIGNGGPQGKLYQKGGLDVYYMPGSAKVTAFKPGFRMLAGNAANTDPKSVKSNAICHRCWTSTDPNVFVGAQPCSSSDSVDIPFGATCKLIRQTIIFPSCWNGKDLDSPDHKSHVAYPTNFAGASGSSKSCPSTHPTVIPQIMYEVMWDVSSFQADRTNFPTDGSNPFMYSMNLGGAAAHGDYVFGWEGDTLQKAMDNIGSCTTDGTCAKAGITKQAESVYEACTKDQQAVEEVDGWLKALPLGDKAVKA